MAKLTIVVHKCKEVEKGDVVYRWRSEHKLYGKPYHASKS